MQIPRLSPMSHVGTPRRGAGSAEVVVAMAMVMAVVSKLRRVIVKVGMKSASAVMR